VLVPVLHGVGAGGIGAILSADSIVAAADKDGIVYSGLPASSTMTIYSSEIDDTNNWTIEANASASVTGSLSGSTYTITGLSSTNGYVDLTATKGTATITKRISVSKTYDGAGEPVTFTYIASTSDSIAKNAIDAVTAGAYAIVKLQATEIVGNDLATPYNGYITIQDSAGNYVNQLL